MTTWKKILLSITVLIFLAGAVLAIYVQSSNSSWQQYLAQLQAAGEPLTFAEIQARRSPQPTTNTIAEVVTRVADILDNVQGPNSQGVYGMSDGPDFDFFVGLDAEAIETTRYYIRPRLSILVELDDLSELAPGRFVIDYTGSALENMNAFPGQSPRTSSITRHLYIVAMLHLIDGNGKASADMIQKLHDIMLPLTEEPSSLAHLMHIIATNSAIDILENVLRVGTIDDETLRQLDQEFADYVNSHSIRWALWGERAIFVTVHGIFPKMSLHATFFSVFVAGLSPFGR